MPGIRILLLLLASQFALAAGPTDSALLALRKTLASGSLMPLLSRQSLVSIPAIDLGDIFVEVPYQRFSVTGFSHANGRYAARVRLHHEDGAVSFIRLRGRYRHSLTVDDLYDYHSGLSLAELAKARHWFVGTQGRQFIKLLGQQPASATLISLSQEQPAARTLWLAQCLGKPCEREAIKHQSAGENAADSRDETRGERAALWKLRRAFSYRQPAAIAGQLDALQRALGDDPYLWWLIGLEALATNDCSAIQPHLENAWLRHRHHLVLADVTLRCELNRIKDQAPPGTQLLNALSQTLGKAALANGVRRFYGANESAVPASLQRWVIVQE